MKRTTLPTVALAITLIAFPASVGPSNKCNKPQPRRENLRSQNRTARPRDLRPLRRLNIILEGDSSRVFLPRDEYEAPPRQSQDQARTKNAARRRGVLAKKYDGVVDDGQRTHHGQAHR